jgi:hypothetical protein
MAANKHSNHVRILYKACGENCLKDSLTNFNDYFYQIHDLILLGTYISLKITGYLACEIGQALASKQNGGVA